MSTQPQTPRPVAPTQVQRPWRTTLRTIFQGILGALVVLPVAVEAAGLDPKTLPVLGGVLAVAAAVTRVMALPAVEAWLGRFVPWLAADPTRGE